MRPWRGLAFWIAAAAVLAIVGYGAFSGSFGPAPRADAGDAEQVALGKRIYDRECASCHGKRLEGQPNWRQRRADGRLPAPPHDATGHTWHHPDQFLFALTKLGPQALAGPGYVSDMPGYAGKLSDREIWAVLAYIKSLWPKQIRERQAAITLQSQQQRKH